MGSDSVVGAIPFKQLTLYVPLIIMATCIANFLICNNNGTCKPWPHSTITQCSTMYPNNVLARFFFLMPSVVLLMIFSAIVGFLKYESSKLRKHITVPSFITQAFYLGFPFFVMAISTIDQGEMADDLHEVSAIIFFVLYDFAIWVVFFTYLKIYLKNPLIASYKSIGIKAACCLYQWFYFVDLIIKLLQPTDPDQKLTDKVEVELEWGLMFTLLIFLGSWYFEFQNVTLSLDENYTFQFEQIEESKKELEQQKQELQQKLAQKQQVYSQVNQVPVYQQKNEQIDNLN